MNLDGALVLTPVLGCAFQRLVSQVGEEIVVGTVHLVCEAQVMVDEGVTIIGGVENHNGVRKRRTIAADLRESTGGVFPRLWENVDPGRSTGSR